MWTSSLCNCQNLFLNWTLLPLWFEDGEEKHGSKVDGRRFFVGDTIKEDRTKYAWAQSGGINAGVILLRPSRETFDQMLMEVMSDLHPEHLPSPGPEQDYLTRFFASAPWHALDVRWNYQLHHLPFALEHLLGWRRHAMTLGQALTEETEAWRPPRLATGLGEIGIVHFSGDVKLWHICLQSSASSEYGAKRRAVKHVTLTPEEWMATDTFSEWLLRDCCEGYGRWFELKGLPEEYHQRGCELLEGGRLEMQAGGAAQDVTPLVQEMVEHLRGATRLATDTWRQCALNLLVEHPTLLQDIQEPQVPEGSYMPGAEVEVQWRPESRPDIDFSWSRGRVMSVHKDGTHVVRFQHGGGWGDTERGVSSDRMRVFVETEMTEQVSHVEHAGA